MTFRNINFIDVKIAKNALRLMETASVAHPCALSDIVATVPYKAKIAVFIYFPWRALFKVNEVAL